MSEKSYIGDGVYAHADGYHVAVLTTEREGRWETIALDDETFYGLLRFVERDRGIRIRVERDPDPLPQAPDQPPPVPAYEQALMTTDDLRHNPPPPPEPFIGDDGKFSGGGATGQWDNSSQSVTDTGSSVGADTGSDVGGSVGGGE